MYAGVTNLAVASSGFFLLIIRHGPQSISA
jgi:hypothetical protein